MSDLTQESLHTPRVSKMAQGLVGSEIIKLAGEVNDRIKQGEIINNLTIGDFNPGIFPIPEKMKSLILDAYQNDQTNYPAANGIAELRESVAAFIKKEQGLDYSPAEFLIAGGARPLIYATYQALVDPEDKVIFPVPSWNNNHYTHLSRGQQILIETTPESNFMPTAESIKPHIQEATLIALCSPLNPTGTVFSEHDLLAISEMVLAENKRRSASDQKPLYLLYDQIYWQLCFGDVKHHDPVNLLQELRPFTIYIDGISKAYAATGVRVGWAFGPEDIIAKMKSILGHVGAWAPKAEQVAVAQYLSKASGEDGFLPKMKEAVHSRLDGLHTGLQQLKAEGFPVDSIAPQAAIYLTAQFNLVGKTTPEGKTIESVEEATSFLLKEAKLAIVPFYAFGASRKSPWYRISVGTVREEQVKEIINQLRNALSLLN